MKFISKVKMLRKKNKRADEEEEKKGEAGATGNKKTSPAEIRLRREFAEIDLPPHAKVIPDPEGDITKFGVTIDLTKEDCMWKGGKYEFRVSIPYAYPHEAPEVHCDTPIYHPNIDTDGNVCLNILRADWKPVLGVNPVILGLIFLFIEPNPNDPLNQEAAAEFRNQPARFKTQVTNSLRGGTVNGIRYPQMIR